MLCSPKERSMSSLPGKGEVVGRVRQGEEKAGEDDPQEESGLRCR